MLDKVRPYFGKLANFGSDYDEKDCLHMCDFSEHNYEYAQRVMEASGSEGLNQYPMKKANACGADSLSALVVDAAGNVCKCWCDIGIEANQIYNIMDEQLTYSSLYFDYMLYDPTEALPCKECKVLPVCMSGCPYKRLKGEKDNCSNYKFILEKVMRDTIQKLQQRREAAADCK